MPLFIVAMGAVVGAVAGDNAIPDNIICSSVGKLTTRPPSSDCRAYSENGRYFCRYDIADVGDEIRLLKNFQLYEKERLLFSLDQAPGSDLYISNSGIVAFLDHTRHYRHELTIHFYDISGQPLFSEKFADASLFGFSPSGNCFGVGAESGFHVISIPGRQIETYESCLQFDIAENDRLIALALEDEVKVYDNGELFRVLPIDFDFPRCVKISTNSGIVAVIDKKHLKVFSMDNGLLLFEKTLAENYSYRDLRLSRDKIIAGIHYRAVNSSMGLIRIYDRSGRLLNEQSSEEKTFPSFDSDENGNEPLPLYDELPWPFFPFDSMRTVWNYYEQHMADLVGDFSYLHQGLDIITPINEPVYAVETGIVKCVLTLGGQSYWRTAISPEQSAGWSSGWLYAHLVPSSIQFDVGDTVQLHDYLGDIIQWHEDWGHIHFVQITDTGLVWQYDDNEWGINYNPLLSLRPHTDLNPPQFENVFLDSKFAFCVNETSDYLDPDSLYGDIDIITKIVDYVGDSPWQQPAFALYYWITNVASGDTLLPQTLAQILNHAYPFYAVNPYVPYATLLYKSDDILMPSSWMDLERNYYHILTNNNGDSLADLSEKLLALPTANYHDDQYRIHVAAYDEYGNCTIDSQDVWFKNGVIDIVDGQVGLPGSFRLMQNHPNPFNSATVIEYCLPADSDVAIDIYDVLGRKIERLLAARQGPGPQQVTWSADEYPSGIYFARLQAQGKSQSLKLVLMK